MRTLNDPPFKLFEDSLVESADQGGQILQGQIVDHLLRHIEARWRPEALALQDQIASGETPATNEIEDLLAMTRVLDGAVAAFPEDEEVRRAREVVARWCDSILTLLHAKNTA